MVYGNLSSGGPPQGNPSFSGLDFRGLISRWCQSVVTFPGGPFLPGASSKQYGSSLRFPRSLPLS